MRFWTNLFLVWLGVRAITVPLTVQPFPAADSSTNAGLKCGRSIRESDGALSLPSLALPSFLNLAGMCSDKTVRCCDWWIPNSVSRTVRRDPTQRGPKCAFVLKKKCAFFLF